MNKNNLQQDLELISQKEPEFYNVLSELIGHLAGTYKDKYEASKGFIDTKKMLYSQEMGGHLAFYQMSRYLQRFSAPDTFKKGANKNDLYKICHYALFECVRKNKIEQDPKNIDHKD